MKYLCDNIIIASATAVQIDIDVDICIAIHIDIYIDIYNDLNTAHTNDVANVNAIDA